MLTANKKYAVFTIDVERFIDTECVHNSGVKVKTDMLDGLDEYIKILDSHNIKATMFTVGKAVSKLEEKLKTYIKRGHTLALHSYDHTAPLSISNNQFREETRRTKEYLEETFNTEVKGYRAPCFSMDDEKLSILKELGFKYDSSRINFEKARHTTKMHLKGFKEVLKGVFKKDYFYEFGIVCHNIFGKNFPISGGGYVRLSNWTFIKTAISQYIKKNNYYVFYLHPFELSKEKIPFIKGLKFYDKMYLGYGFLSYPFKVNAIINMLKKSGYTFVTFDELADIMDNIK